jgi:hypothetical protein
MAGPAMSGVTFPLAAATAVQDALVVAVLTTLIAPPALRRLT